MTGSHLGVALDPLELAGLRLAIGEQPSEELPSIAGDALVRGFDSPLLREAAGVSANEPRDAAELFTAALGELGIPIPEEQEALWSLAQHVAGEIVAGRREPYEGAAWIWHAIYHRIDAEGDLRVFVGLASEWDDHPNHRGEIETSIVEASRALVARERPRRWLKVQAREGEFPLVEPRTQRSVDPADLPLTTALRQQLVAWRARYDETWEQSGFEAADDAKDFVGAGLGLVGQLQDELGPEWHVEYMPEPVALPGLRLARRHGVWRSRLGRLVRGTYPGTD